MLVPSVLKGPSFRQPSSLCERNCPSWNVFIIRKLGMIGFCCHYALHLVCWAVDFRKLAKLFHTLSSFEGGRSFCSPRDTDNTRIEQNTQAGHWKQLKTPGTTVSPKRPQSFTKKDKPPLGIDSFISKPILTPSDSNIISVHSVAGGLAYLRYTSRCVVGRSAPLLRLGNPRKNTQPVAASGIFSLMVLLFALFQ